MKDQIQKVSHAPFRFTNFLVAESSIKILPETEAKSINIDIKPNGIIDNNKKQFELQLSINLTSEDGFNLSVLIIGFFDFKNVIETENLHNYFYTNAPAILFPYLRSYVSALTALAGGNTIIIPPINISPIGKDLEKNIKIKD